MKSLIIPLGLSIAVATAADDVELAMKLSNPIADLISAPIQSNYDFGIGAGDGTRWTTNIQPVMPFSLTENWNLISRTVLPVVDQEGVALGGAGDAFGLGDTVQSFFFSPKASSPIWGVGPAFLLPTATDDLLGGDQWGMGPTAVVLKQTGPWTYGALANHLWDFAGDSDRPGVNATFIQPFLAYTLPTATTFTLNLESTYDWRDRPMDRSGQFPGEPTRQIRQPARPVVRRHSCLPGSSGRRPRVGREVRHDLSVPEKLIDQPLQTLQPDFRAPHNTNQPRNIP